MSNAKSSKVRFQEFIERRKEQGLVRVTAVVHKDDVQRVRQFAALLRGEVPL